MAQRTQSFHRMGLAALLSLTLTACGTETAPGGGDVQAAQQAGMSGAVQVQLLAINDFHGNLAPPSGSSGRIGTVNAGGAEYLATHLAALAAENPNTLIVSAGDNNNPNTNGRSYSVTW